MLLLREEHEVIGLREDDFEDVVRDEWLPSLAKSDGARLLYYTHLAHGSGLSYRAVTLTWLRDAGAWGELVNRVHDGDLRTLVEKLDSMRYDVTSKHLVTLPWSQIQAFDVDAIPSEPADHEPTVYMEDTMWPHQGKLEEYVERAGAQYATEFKNRVPEDQQLLEIEGAYRTAFGSHRRNEVVLWQKVLRPEGVLRLITHDMPREYKQPGRWMLDALSLRDQWQSRLLRTSRWSPLA